MEITFSEDGWMIAAFVCTFLFVMTIAVSGVTASDKEDREKANGGTYRFKRGRFAFKSFIAFIVLYSAANLVVATAAYAFAPSTREASTIDIAAHFGLESGKEYPLILGDTQGGTLGSASQRYGLFGASTAVDLRPTTTVSVGFQKEESWWQLTLPTDTTTFERGSDSSVTIWLVDSKDTSATWGNYWEQTWGECNWEYHNFWFVCTHELESETFVIDKDTERLGLATVVNQNFSSATIRLNEEQHSALFPSN